MFTELFLRSVVAGAYLMALLLNGRFDLLTGLIAGSLVLIWAVPQLRRIAYRRSRPAHGA